MAEIRQVTFSVPEWNTGMGFYRTRFDWWYRFVLWAYEKVEEDGTMVWPWRLTYEIHMKMASKRLADHIDAQILKDCAKGFEAMGKAYMRVSVCAEGCVEAIQNVRRSLDSIVICRAEGCSGRRAVRGSTLCSYHGGMSLPMPRWTGGKRTGIDFQLPVC